MATIRRKKSESFAILSSPGPWPQVLINWLATLAVIIVFGLIMLFSASYTTGYLRMGDSFYYIKSQVFCLGLGLAVMLLFSRIDHRFLRRMVGPGYVVCIVMLIAVLFSYRRKRVYDLQRIEQAERVDVSYNPKSLAVAGVSIVAAFVAQLWLDSMIIGALVGFVVFSLSGVVRWKETDDLFTEGMKMMATIGFIMIAAAGFAEVMKATGEVQSLVDASVAWIGNSKAVGAMLMLLVGLLVTMGIGSSFSTVPIIAAIFVPLAVQLGFSPLAIVSIVGTAGALGDAGSPASDSTLGPTSGLNVDGQHNHIWDTVVPTFLHYNLPLLVFGWAAAMLL